MHKCDSAYSVCRISEFGKNQNSTTKYMVTLQRSICVSEIIIVFIVAAALVITAAIITVGIVFMKRYAENRFIFVYILMYIAIVVL